MSKEQGKPAGNPRDLVSVIIFSILLIAILTVLIFVLDERESESPGKPRAYNTVKDEIQNAVTAYQTDHNLEIPTLNGIYTNADCSNCSVINISALVIANGGMLRESPDGLYLSISGNDNCLGDASLGCRNESHYIWIVNTTYGTVYSYCAGIGCKTNNSGYQDVWP